MSGQSNEFKAVTKSGNQDIDGILWSSRWADPTQLTFSFPDTVAEYDGFDYKAETFSAFSEPAKQAARDALNIFESYTQLQFSEVDETTTQYGNFRFANSSDKSLGTATGALPGGLSGSGGDMHFNSTANPGYANPVLGTYDFFVTMHEIGHALGLVHGHDSTNPFGKLPNNHDSIEYSIMTYASYIGQSTTKNNIDTTPGEFAQSLMQNDIAALQYLYGANYDTNKEDTVYKFSAKTGEMFVNGDGQGAPSRNVIFRTIWDGSGEDTYDLSDFSSDMKINLAPGAANIFNKAQLSDLDFKAPVRLASGNVYNALLFEGDEKSLIENAFSGEGNDELKGNQIANKLMGNGKDDDLYGFAGNDKLYGGTGDDDLLGGADADVLDGGAGNDWTYYFDSNAGVIINLVGSFGLGGYAAGDQIFEIENVVGSNHKDIFYANTVSNIFKGGSDLDLVSYEQFGEGVTLSLANAGKQKISGSDFDQFVDIERLEGTAHDDRLLGSNGQNILWGLGGNDYLDGLGNQGGNDQLIGGAGNDTYVIGTDQITLLEFFGQGRDQVLTTVTFTLPDEIEDLFLSGTAQNGFGNSAWNVIEGTNNNNNTLEGRDGNDTLRGFAGNDTLRGENHDDLIIGGAGADRMFGGTGIDTVSWEGSSNGVTAALGAVVDANGSALAKGLGGDSLKDEFQGFENLIGSGRNDKLTGNDADNEITGGLGNDVLSGAGGNDIFHVAPNQGTGDIFDGGDGADDMIWWQGGGDIVLENFQDHNIEFWAGNGGALIGTAGTNIFIFETVTAINLAYIDGGKGVDAIAGRDKADDDLRGGDGDDLLNGWGGHDTLDGGANNDLLLGGEGNDTLIGGSGTNSLAGEGGDDVLKVSAGSSVLGLGGGDGTDTLAVTGFGTLIMAGFNRFTASIEKLDANGVELFGTKNADEFDLSGSGLQVLSNFSSIDGKEGDDDIAGTNSDDMLLGGAGNDELSGGFGNDNLDGGAGADELEGEDGDDIFWIRNDEALGDTFDGGAGNDALAFLGLGSAVFKNFNAGAASIEALLGNHVGLKGTDDVNVFDFSYLTSVVALPSIDLLRGDDVAFGSNVDDTILGGFGKDLVHGGKGNDKIDGGGGNDTLFGDDGDDTINGSRDADTIFGGNGNDTITFTGTSVGVTVYLDGITPGAKGDAEGDIVKTDVENAIGTRSSDKITGNDGNNRLEGGEGDDQLFGGKGNDTLDGGGGNDTLNGGDGNDTILISSTDSLSAKIDGGDGHDTIVVTGTKALSLVEFSTGTGGVESWHGNGLGVVGTAAANTLDFSGLTGVQNFGAINAGAGDDVISGSDADDIIDGGAGTDTIDGGKGVDVASYAAFKTGFTIALDEEGDPILGPDGDTLISIDGIFGGQSADKLTGTSGKNIFNGGKGADVINSGDGDDIIQIAGVEATGDTVDAGSGGETNGDILELVGTGDVFLVGFKASEWGIERILGNGRILRGSAGGETFDFTGVTVLNTLNHVDAGFGEDTLIGMDDVTFGDHLRGGGDNDTISGGLGSDQLYGGDRDDVIDGGEGHDHIDGGTGNDILTGGDGDDIIAVQGTEAKGDSFEGGDGKDTLYILGNNAKTSLVLLNFNTGFASIEQVYGSGQAIVGDKGDNILDFSSVEFEFAFNGAKHAIGYFDGGAGNDEISGTQLDDDLRGGTGQDKLNGGGGNDRINGGAEYDFIDGGAGDDTLVITGTEGMFDDLHGGDGHDTVEVSGGGAVTLHKFSTVDYSIERWTWNKNKVGKVVGTGGDDELDFSNLTVMQPIASIDGLGGNDTIIGSFNFDIIKGGAGDDTLNGSSGTDHLDGGAGNDTFIMQVGDDAEVITGFVAGGLEDVVHVKSFAFIDGLNDFDDLMALGKQTGSGKTLQTTFDFGGGDVLLLNGVAKASLTEDDFLFIPEDKGGGGSGEFAAISVDVVKFEPYDQDYGGTPHVEISADGNSMVFAAFSGGVYNVFLYDMTSGQTTLVSHVDGLPALTGTGNSIGPSISADGRFVAYATDAADVAFAGAGLMVYDADSGVNTLLVPLNGSQIFDPSISGDGRHVVFTTDADLTGDNSDTDFGFDVYLYDRLTSMIDLVSTGSQNFDATVSDDGRFVAYMSVDSFDPSIVLHDRVGQTTTVISTGGQSTGPSMSANGQFVVFETMLVHDLNDKNGDFDIYLYNQLDSSYTLVSTDGAEAANGTSRYASISADGKFVTFLSDADDLVAGDTNNDNDVFVYEVATGTITRVLDDKGNELPNGVSANTPDISGNGSAVGFISIDDLLAGDTNGVTDAYVTQRSPDAEPIFGNLEADVLIGTDEIDTIVAYGGDDQIFGGKGSDTLDGGAGADTYGYLDVSDSPDVPLGPDAVFFEIGVDKINLTQIDAKESTPEDDEFDFGSGTNEGLIAIVDKGQVNIGGTDYFYSQVIASTIEDGDAEFAIDILSLTGIIQPSDILL